MRTFYLLLRAGFHTILLFVLPWLTGAMVGLVFDVQEVAETKARFAAIFSMVIVPLLGAQIAGVVVKVGREVRAQAREGRRGGAVWVSAIDKHVRVLTGRGLGMAAASLAMVGVALSAKWGQFGVLAVAGLGIMYIASTAATVLSAFAVRAFDDRVRRGRGSIDREMSPTVIEAGDPAEERFVLARIPVPPFFRLHIEEALPARLGGDTRFALDRTVSRAEVTVSAPLPRTPRGVYRLGPASIWYEDILGLTRVFVAARASASLRALPRLRPIVYDRRPRSVAKSEGPLSVLSRLATEEHFRTRQYVPGDDVRRVHWKQSINTGQLVVRVPESVPYAPTRVRLLLDTYLPPGWRLTPNMARGPLRKDDPNGVRAPDVLEDVLDLLVESWIGLAQSLLRRGESVSLAVVVRDGGASVLREIDCKRGEERKWRAVGSDAAWQSDVPIDVLTGRLPAASTKASAIVISAGLWLGASAPPTGTSFIVADGASVVLTPPPDAHGVVKKLLMFDYPVGAEDNRLDLKRLLSASPPTPERLRSELAKAAAFAVERARSMQAPVLIARRRGLAIALETP